MWCDTFRGVGRSCSGSLPCDAGRSATEVHRLTRRVLLIAHTWLELLWSWKSVPVVALAALVALPCCRGSAPTQPDSSVCPDSDGDHGAYGCVITPMVLLDSAGTPQRSIAISMQFLQLPNRPALQNTTYALTDAFGRFTFDWIFTFPGYVDGDSVSVHLVATDQTTGLGAYDSTDVRVVFTGVGKRFSRDTIRWRAKLSH